jgi:hypothetical protein
MKLKLNILVMLILISVLSSSCFKTNDTPGNNKNGIGEYVLNIEVISGSGSSKTLVGEKVDTNYDPNLKTIYLGTDDDNEPLGTLTLEIDSPFTASDGNQYANVSSATLSTTDKREGTGGELNARLYKLKAGFEASLPIEELNSDFIKVTDLTIIMDRVIVHPEDEPEEIKLTGHFTANIS